MEQTSNTETPKSLEQLQKALFFTLLSKPVLLEGEYMSQNCDIQVSGVDGEVRSVLYCHDNILPASIRPIMVKAAELATQNVVQLKYRLNAKAFASLIVIAGWESRQLIVPDLEIHEDVDFHVDVQLEIEGIAVTVRSCEWDTEDRTFVIQPFKPQDETAAHEPGTPTTP